MPKVDIYTKVPPAGSMHRETLLNRLATNESAIARLNKLVQDTRELTRIIDLHVRQAQILEFMDTLPYKVGDTVSCRHGSSYKITEFLPLGTPESRVIPSVRLANTGKTKARANISMPWYTVVPLGAGTNWYIGRWHINCGSERLKPVWSSPAA